MLALGIIIGLLAGLLAAALFMVVATLHTAINYGDQFVEYMDSIKK